MDGDQQVSDKYCRKKRNKDFLQNHLSTNCMFHHEWQNACYGQWRDLHLVIEYYLSLVRLVCEQSEIHHQNILGIHCNEHRYCQSAKNEHCCCFFCACSQLFHVGLKLVHHPFLLLNHLLLLLGDGFCQIYWQSP